MVKKQDKNNSKRPGNQEEAGYPAKAGKIGHSTPYDYCNSVGWVERERNPTPTMSFVETLGFVPQPNLPRCWK